MEAAKKVIDAREELGMRGRRGAVVKAMVELIREHKLSYEEFVEFGKAARDKMELTRPARKPVIKPIPSADDVAKFLAEIERADTTDALMIKILLFLGIRSVELTRIRIADIDTTPGAERIFVHRKGGLDKWFVVPGKLSSLLRMYLQGCDKQIYLFESSYHKAYTTRAIRKKIQMYRERAGIGDVIHAHNFRHMLLTLLASQGWSDSELQLVSGHASRTSLDRYIYQNPETIRTKLNKDLNSVMGGLS